MIVRLPSCAAYATQVEKEHRWLPVLAPRLPLAIPKPIALGKPGDGYAWHCAIRRWLEGETATQAGMSDLSQFGEDLGKFLDALHRIDSRGGPSPGRDNFFRGGRLATCDAEARRAIRALEGEIDSSTVMRIWDDAAATEWGQHPVWVHGDMSAGNLLVHDGRLASVIDFGSMAVGDPAATWPSLGRFSPPKVEPHSGLGFGLMRAPGSAGAVGRCGRHRSSQRGSRGRTRSRKLSVGERLQKC